jgi:peptidyl-prolyl cis-trans isomerase C
MTMQEATGSIPGVCGSRLAARAAGLGFGLVLAVGVGAQALPLTPEVVARRGGAELTLGDVDAKLRSMPPEIRGSYLDDPERAGRLIEALLLSRQAAIEAERAGIDKTVEFQQDLALQRTELLARHWTDYRTRNLQLPNFEALAKEKYLANPEAYAPPVQIDLRHVLLSTDGKDEDEALETAHEVLRRAKAGESFVNLVAEFSDEPSKDRRHGLIENADPSRLDNRFAQAMMGLREVGDVVGPVRSRFGYHVIRLERFEQPDAPPFDKIAESIIEQQREQYVVAERSRYLASLSSLPLELNDALVRSLLSRNLGSGDGVTSEGAATGVEAAN